MPAVRKYNKGPKNVNRKRYSKRSSNKSLVSLIKKVSLSTQETKMATQNARIPLFHNGGTAQQGKPIVMFQNLLKTNQGITDGTGLSHRVGDCISPVGVKLYMQFDQPNDRPNVTFKVFVVKIKSHSVQTNLPMKQITQNLMQDPVDTEYCFIVSTRTFKYGDNYWNPTEPKSTCFFKKMWIKLPNYQYVYKADNDSLGKDYQLAVFCGAYDTGSTLTTDNIGTVSFNSALYFKDA